MSEAMLGYIEAAFLLFGIVVFGWLAARAYDPARKAELEGRGRLPVEPDDLEGDSHGQA